MSEQDKKTLQSLPLNLEHTQLLKPEALQIHQADPLQQEVPGTHSLQIILNDHIMTKLHSSGDLKDFTLKCLQQSYGRREESDEDEDASQSPSQNPNKQNDSLKNKGPEQSSGSDAVPVSRLSKDNHLSARDLREEEASNFTNLMKNSRGNIGTPLQQSEIKKGTQNEKNQNFFRQTHHLKLTNGNDIDTHSESTVFKNQINSRLTLTSHFGNGQDQDDLNQSISAHHLSNSKKNADPLNNQNQIDMSSVNQDLILDESLNKLLFIQDKNLMQNQPHQVSNVKGLKNGRAAKSQFSKQANMYSQSEKKDDSKNKARSITSSKLSSTKLQLPSVNKIEEVIGISKQNVIEHILTKKRDQKQSEKSDKNLAKTVQPLHTKNSKSLAVEKLPKIGKLDELNFPLQKLSTGELQRPASLDFFNSNFQNTNQLFAGGYDPSSLPKSSDQEMLLNNLRQEIDLNQYLQQQLMMQETSGANPFQQAINFGNQNQVQPGLTLPSMLGNQNNHNLVSLQATKQKESCSVLPFAPNIARGQSIDMNPLQLQDNKGIEHQQSLQNSLNNMFDQQVQMLGQNNFGNGIQQIMNNNNCAGIIESMVNNGMMNQFGGMNIDPSAINKQQLLQTLSKSSNSMDSLRLAILAQDNQQDNDTLLKSFNYHQLFNQHLSNQHQNSQQNNSSEVKQLKDNQINQSIPASNPPQQMLENGNKKEQQNFNKPLLPPLNPFLPQINQIQQQLVQQQQFHPQNISFGGMGLTDSQLFGTNALPSLTAMNLKNGAYFSNPALGGSLLNQLISQSKSELASQSLHNMSSLQQNSILSERGIFKQLTLLEQWQLLSNLLRDPNAMESMNMDHLTLSQMQTQLLPELQKYQNQFIQDCKQLSNQEGQTSLSFLPIMNQDPCAVAGSVDFNKKRLVERIDEIDHEIIKNFTQKGLLGQGHSKSKAQISPSKDSIEEEERSREERTEKKEKYLK